MLTITAQGGDIAFGSLGSELDQRIEQKTCL
jgi:hypothetical protein